MAADYWIRREEVSVGPLALAAILSVPDRARGVVVFAHGSGSSRNSPRNVQVAAALHARRFATLLLDLLTVEEAHTRSNVFDIELLSERVVQAVHWIGRDPRTEHLPVGLFGASTGAAAALAAAARLPGNVRVVVSRGGRPDLAGAELGNVRAPTLLIVGGADHAVIKLNTDALHHLTCLKRLEVIPGATHLFEEEGALESMTSAAAHWFDLYLLPEKAAQASAAGKR